MTREDIIKMAREAYGSWYPNAVPPELERFAALVAAEERERCYEFIETLVDAEREACAKVCEELVLAHAGRADLTADQCAAAIRARGKK